MTERQIHNARVKRERELQIKTNFLKTCMVIVFITCAISFFFMYNTADASPLEDLDNYPTAGATSELMEMAVVCESNPSVIEEETEVVTQEEPEDCTYSDTDLELLARVIYLEAGAENMSDEAMIYVGCVLLNRVNSWRYPDTLEECIYQPHQYQCASRLFKVTPSERSYRIARYLLENGTDGILSEGYLGQAGWEQGDAGFWLEGIYFAYFEKH